MAFDPCCLLDTSFDGISNAFSGSSDCNKRNPAPTFALTSVKANWLCQLLESLAFCQQRQKAASQHA